MVKEQKKLEIEPERGRFRELIATNPNYFGNLEESGFEAVSPMAGNTKYEELTCVGFNPDANRLEATVAIKLPFGYGGDLCADGTLEYVRFYLDYGAGWEDAGVAAFNAHDIPDATDCAGQQEKPLCYVASRIIEPQKKYCKHAVLPRVRAILSWNQLPPANAPGWPPVWGNVLERDIQIKPRHRLFLDVLDVAGTDLLEKLKIDLPVEEVAEVPLPLPDPPPFDLAELTVLYGAGRGAEGAPRVEPHRFAFAELKAALELPAVNQQELVAKSAEWKALGLDFVQAVQGLVSTAGSVRYEELDCVGLDYNLEHLVATFRIKRPTGYSGGLCSPGSREYVSFWADWDGACRWDHLGTVSVDVHDIPAIPAGGLHYAVFLPVDLKYHRRGCEHPKIGRVRAVLSWNTPPPSDPDRLPTWGNRLDCHVQIRPGTGLGGGEIAPLFHRIGGIRDDDVHGVSGLTLPSATFDNGDLADFAGRPCPFAERVVVTGPPFPGHFYRLEVRKLGEGWTALKNTIEIEPLVGLKFSKSPVIAGEYYSYETLPNNPDLVLGWWETSGDDLWEVKLDVLGQPGAVIQRVRLKNSGVEDARIHISSGGDCKDFTVDALLTGAFVARDPYLRSYSLGTAPFAAPAGQLNPTGGTLPTPSAPAIPTAPPPGGATWTLDTTGMKPCGYTVHLNVWDRAIRRSVPLRHHRHASVGFCLRQGTE